MFLFILLVKQNHTFSSRKLFEVVEKSEFLFTPHPPAPPKRKRVLILNANQRFLREREVSSDLHHFTYRSFNLTSTVWDMTTTPREWGSAWGVLGTQLKEPEEFPRLEPRSLKSLKFRRGFKIFTQSSLLVYWRPSPTSKQRHSSLYNTFFPTYQVTYSMDKWDTIIRQDLAKM